MNYGGIQCKNHLPPSLFHHTCPKSCPRHQQELRVASDVISRTDVSSEPREDTRSPSEDQIRSRAYEIYIESGYEDGRATEHWLAAERELLDESTLQTIGSPSVKSSQ